MTIYYDEGDDCVIPSCTGELAYEYEGECYCHTSPPCSHCTNADLLCDVCGHDPYDAFITAPEKLK